MPVAIRAPTTSPAPSSTPAFEAPSLQWLHGTWHVTHSTLPMWKSKRNVKITYKTLEPSSSGPSTTAESNKLDDLVEYQPLNSDKWKSVHGIDTASGGDASAWDWRGTGLLKIASSHWEVLGWGTKDGAEWVVTYFAKTLFTPAGIDIYSRSAGGLPTPLVDEIKEGMAGVEDSAFKELKDQIFEIKHDAGTLP